MKTRLYRSLTCWVVVLLTMPVLAAEPVVIATSGAGQSPKQPQAAVATDGTVHLIYGSGDAVFHCQSTDAGATFTKPQEAFRISNMSLGMRRGPRISVAGNAVVVTAVGGMQGKGRDGDVLAWRSTDSGATWQGPVRVNDAADSAREGLHGMASGPDGSVWATWLDLREKRSEVYASKSTDGGETWQPNVRVYRSPDGNVCECCHPSILVSDDAVHVMFRNSLAGNRDMYVATSKDDGKTFATAKKAGQGSWKLNACPMDGGMLAAGPNGSLVTVWRRNGEVYSAVSTGGREQLLGRGEQPWIASSSNGPVIVWTTSREGDLLVQSPASNQPQKLAGAARDPMVSSTTNGEGPVIACWESKLNGQPVVLAARIDVGKPKSR
ncbi:MAG: exo-alpha-sialidase [Planctomycetaceae bacterium]|nr:exo-alpha-sialidase [Planctomycetaceae bacterium]